MNAMNTATSGHRSAVHGADGRPPRLELTRRGRLVLSVLVFLIGLIAAVGVLFALGVPSAFADAGQDSVVVTVEQGDTLWGYAEQYAPDGADPRDYVLQVQHMNDLSTARVSAGTQVELPVSDAMAR